MPWGLRIGGWGQGDRTGQKTEEAWRREGSERRQGMGTEDRTDWQAPGGQRDSRIQKSGTRYRGLKERGLRMALSTRPRTGWGQTENRGLETQAKG